MGRVNVEAVGHVVQLFGRHQAFGGQRGPENGERVPAQGRSGAVEHGDLTKAWTWQHLALLHGVGLTLSTTGAYHDGGPQHGEFYDSDFGGAMYADGDEGLRLPPLSIAENQRARSLAREIHERARQRFAPPH